MKLRNVVTGTLALTLLFFAGCSGEGDGGKGTGAGAGAGDPLAVANQFMDLYYHKANIKEAAALAIPEQAEKILAAPGSPAGDASKEKDAGQEISYTLKEKSQEGVHSYALYTIVIPRKGAEPIYKTAALFVDQAKAGEAWKITLFDEKTQSTPHEETTRR